MIFLACKNIINTDGEGLNDTA